MAVRRGNQFRRAKTTKLPMRKVRSSTKRSGSHNTKQYQSTRNERRKAQARVGKMQQALNKAVSPKARARLQAEIDLYNRQIESTRTYSAETGKRIRDKAEVARNTAMLASMNEQFGSFVHSQRRANKATQIEINRASAGEKSQYTKTQVQIFYRATQRAWQNVPLEKRNEAILAYYGRTNLEDLFSEVTADKRNRDVQWAIDVMNNPDASEEDRRSAFDIIKDNEADFRISPSHGAGATIPDVPPVALA